MSGRKSDRGEEGTDFEPVIDTSLLYAYVGKRDPHQTVLDGRLGADDDGFWLRTWRNDDR